MTNRQFNYYVGFVVALVILAIVLPSLCYWDSKTTASFTVSGKERVSTGSGDTLQHKYLVYTDDETFEVVDTLIFLKFNSSDRYGHLQTGTKYIARVAGWRLPFFSTYRNILDATQVEAESP